MNDLDFNNMDGIEYAKMFPDGITEVTRALDAIVDLRLQVAAFQTNGATPSATEMGKHKRDKLEAAIYLKQVLDDYITRRVRKVLAERT